MSHFSVGSGVGTQRATINGSQELEDRAERQRDILKDKVQHSSSFTTLLREKPQARSVTVATPILYIRSTLSSLTLGCSAAKHQFKEKLVVR